MKRILILAAVAALSVAAVAMAGSRSSHHARPAVLRVASVSARAACSDPAHCPVGCGGASATAAVASAKAKPVTGAASCTGNPASCPASCRSAAAGATAEQVDSH